MQTLRSEQGDPVFDVKLSFEFVELVPRIEHFGDTFADLYDHSILLTSTEARELARILLEEAN